MPKLFVVCRQRKFNIKADSYVCGLLYTVYQIRWLLERLVVITTEQGHRHETSYQSKERHKN